MLFNIAEEKNIHQPSVVKYSRTAVSPLESINSVIHLPTRDSFDVPGIKDDTTNSQSPVSKYNTALPIRLSTDGPGYSSDPFWLENSARAWLERVCYTTKMTATGAGYHKSGVVVVAGILCSVTAVTHLETHYYPQYIRLLVEMARSVYYSKFSPKNALIICRWSYSTFQIILFVFLLIPHRLVTKRSRAIIDDITSFSARAVAGTVTWQQYRTTDGIVIDI